MHARLGKQRAAEAQQQRRVEREREAAERAALEMTSVGSQVKSESYMRRVTKTGATLLDPTSRWPRIEPSQHVTMKDWKFGLGLGKDGDILDMMADKYPNTAASSRAEAAARAAALPEPVAARSVLADPVASLTLSPLKSASARALAEEARERGEPADEVVEPELPGLWDDGVPAPPGPPSPLKGATLSVLEKRYMAAARQRQRDNVVVEQTVCGKTWRGPAFVPSEPVLEFLDFEAGETYVKTFALTNVSNSFNSFRPAAFPPEVASFFLLEHQPPGRMVAGRSVSLKLTFTPKLGEDIDTVLLLLTHTGPMSVPIRCAPKKLAVLLQTSALHFGTVVLGESASLTLEVKNSGALGTAFAVSLQRGAGDAADEAGKAVFEAGSGGTITLAPRSKATVSLRFTPAAAGSASALLRLDFGGDWRAEHVELSGSGAQVPIYLPRPMIDLRTCLVGALYRDELRVCNRSAVAQQVALRVPPSLEGCLEFSPVTALVQAHGSVGVQLKFTVLDTLRESCAKHLVEEDTIAFPIRLTVRGQAAPVRFTLRATLTTSELLICGADGETMLHILDFGDVPVTARRQLPISLHNPSSLPQRFGFSSTEPEVLQVQPGDGLGTILPGETLQRSVLFSPSADTRFSLSLECRTSHNRKYSFRCVGRGVKPPLRLSTSLLRLPATAEGDTASVELSLANDSSQPHDYELRPPADSGLAVAPQIGTLAAGASVRVVVSFTAPQRSASVEAAGELAAESADVEEASPASGDGGEDAEGGGDGGDGGGSEGLADEGPDEATHPEAVEPQRGPPASDEMVVRVAALLNRELERLAVDPSKRSWFKLFKQVDADGSGLISFDEFKHMVRKDLKLSPGRLSAKELREVWLVLDDDGGGHVSAGEFGKFMARGAEPNAGEDRRDGLADPVRDVVEPRSQHATSCVCCYVRPSGGASDAPAPHTSFFLEVETTSVAAGVVLSNGLVRQSVDFGNVPVDQTREVVVAVQSRLALPAHLALEPLCPAGPFSVLNAPPALEPGASAELTLRYKPVAPVPSFETLIVATEGACGEPLRLTLSLRGSGDSPLLRLVPEEEAPPVSFGPAAAPTRAVHVGDVLVADRATRSFDLVNESAFPVTFALRAVKSGHANLGPLPPFDVSPTAGEIPPGGAQPLSFTFAPDHASVHFFQLVEVAMAGGSDAGEPSAPLLQLFVTGRAWLSSGFVLPPAMSGAQSLLAPPPLDVSAAAEGGDAAAAASEEAEEMVIELAPSGGGGKAVYELTFGNASSEAKKPPPLEVSFEGLSEEAVQVGFSVEPKKLSVEAGATKTATLSFELGESALQGTQLGLIASLGMTQWAEARLKVLCKGGAPAMHQPEWPLLLKGLVLGRAATGGAPGVTDHR
mmetsp:Transcript_13263/g.44213  ORF Transcript_13263/g.44213 Transcript_13263/m.44213 type:complete len:1380 (-) Transcript_13263:173-4312(-)